MGISWPEIDRRYSTSLEQSCGECGWHRDDLHKEAVHCPECSASLSGEIEESFDSLFEEDQRR